MAKNISATLDLNKSVKIFHFQVTKLLEFTNITEWNGTKLREREEEIREQAMILAGQCIAVLLYNLSKSPKILNYSVSQTQGWRNLNTHSSWL